MEQSEVRLLLDTHTWFWWLMGSSRLTLKARAAILDSENQTMVSAVSVYELVRKYRIGKLPEMQQIAENVERVIDEDEFSRLPITTLHAEKAASFSQDHRDPFDRLLIAQSLVEDIVFISSEELFDTFGVKRLWQ